MFLIPLFSAKLIAVIAAFLAHMFDLGVGTIIGAYFALGLVSYVGLALMTASRRRADQHEDELRRQIYALREK